MSPKKDVASPTGPLLMGDSVKSYKMRKIDFTTLMMLCNVVASLGHWQTAAALGIQTDACI